MKHRLLFPASHEFRRQFYESLPCAYIKISQEGRRRLIRAARLNGVSVKCVLFSEALKENNRSEIKMKGIL